MDITRDVMGMLEQGGSLKEIRAAIDRDYSRFGPSTQTDALP